MGCGQCATGSCGSINKDYKENFDPSVSVLSGCATKGCSKLNSFDWLNDMDYTSSNKFKIVEVKFKGGRKEYYSNSKDIILNTGDFVVCNSEFGYCIGSVSLQGDLVRLQLGKKGIDSKGDFQEILRIANESDLRRHQEAINRDLPAMYRTRELVSKLNLNMKVSDVEFQSDNTKATFFYSAESRIDFRELIKHLASEFKIRVEMRQISLRQEASRIGGLGSCGRELCCSSWLTDFKTIPTSAARFQKLSLNQAKLSGQCGRLKCCLNFELETYIDALSDIPEVEKLKTEKGVAYLQKTDIFRKLMWFSYENDNNWHVITCKQASEIEKMNKRNLKPISLDNLNEIQLTEDKEKINTDLERLDKKFIEKRRKKGRNSNHNKKRKKRYDPR